MIGRENLCRIQLQFVGHLREIRNLTLCLQVSTYRSRWRAMVSIHRFTAFTGSPPVEMVSGLDSMFLTAYQLFVAPE